MCIINFKRYYQGALGVPAREIAAEELQHWRFYSSKAHMQTNLVLTKPTYWWLWINFDPIDTKAIQG